MAETLQPEVERLASFGRALEGTIDITQEDIDEVPSDEGSTSVSLEALPPAKVKMLELLKKKRTNMSLYKTLQGNPSEGLLYFSKMEPVI
jgi:hypothetical protein